METIGKLERYEGHLLNWYDIPTLAPLKPRYVSTVDSGNLLGALWVLDQGLESLMQAPLLDAKPFAGLRDTGEILRQVAREENPAGLDVHALDDLLRAWESPPDHIADQLLLRRAESSVGELSEMADGIRLAQTGAAYWVGQMQSQLAAWLNIADRYLAWIEILAEKTEEDESPGWIRTPCRLSARPFTTRPRCRIWPTETSPASQSLQASGRRGRPMDPASRTGLTA
jgi:cyclic beta-1,2-glucan synthetase